MKKVLLLLLFFCFAVHLKSLAVVLRTDTLVQILKLKDTNLREHKLVKYIQDNFGGIPIDSVAPDKIKVDKFFTNYYINNIEAYDLYIESIYQNRLLNSDEAQRDLSKAIEIAARSGDHYLLYTFLSHVAFIQTYNGNAIGAIASFGEAKKEAMYLKDAYLEVIIDINISDIYYRYNFYSQSLDYLRQAQELVTREQMTDPRLWNIIYYNKCENYFKMGSSDSVVKYSSLLKNSKNTTAKLYTYINRTQYFIYLLNHNYKKVIQIITALPGDKQYKFETIDKQNLADAWVNTGQPDSAKKVIDGLLADKGKIIILK